LDLARLENALADRSLRVGIVGFGYVGSCLGAVLTARGFSVLGVDVRPDLVDEVNQGRIPFNEPGLPEALARAHEAGLLEATTEFARVGEVDVVLLCVGTPLGEGFEPDTSQVEAAARALAPHLRAGHLVILKSTAPPGTTEDIVAPALGLPSRHRESYRDPGIRLAFCPERLAEGSALRELMTIPVVVGGIDAPSREAAVAFWAGALGVDTVPVRNARTAEMVKLANNQWIDLNIALANELARLSERVGVDALEVILAANSLPKGQHHVNILSPSMGVGGSCLTKDPWFLAHLGERLGVTLRLPAAGRQVNDAMPTHAVDRIRQGLAARGKALEDATVAVLGVAFKSNTGDCRSSPTRAAIEALQAACREVRVHDPLVTEDDARLVTSLPLVPSVDDALRGADCVAYFTGHDVFRTLSLERVAALAPGALVMDGRMYFPPEAIARMDELGMGFAGIGR
jgi:dTDP-alpha-D-glucose dehydrogenase